MSKPSLYAVTSREVEPVTDLLKAIVEVNWHVARAEQMGWSVELEVHDGDNRVRVNVLRGEGWPTEDSEADAARP